VFPVGEEDHLFRTARRQAREVGIGVGKGPGNVRVGLQGIEEEHPADDGFQVPPLPDPAGQFQPGLPGKGNQVEGVSHEKIFPEKGPGDIFGGFLKRGAHARRGVQHQDKINGPPRLGPRPERQGAKQDTN
jgi:hypothetical protein